MRGTIRAVVPRVYDHTRHPHKSAILYSIPNSDSHLTPQGPPHHTQVQSHHTGRTTGQGRSPLASTLDAALICLVVQVVVTWPVPSILLLLTMKFISYRLSWSSKSPVFPQLPQDIGGFFRPFRSSPAPAHACLSANLDIQLYLFLLSFFSWLGCFLHRT